MSELIVDLVSVNVGLPGLLGERRGRMVESGIRKRSVTGSEIHVSFGNLAGDGQADMRNHGGRDKAVYAHPADHWSAWNEELHPELPFGPGSFGENLTTNGWIEEDVFIGDIWRWGPALLQVAQPRYPCFKLALATDRLAVVKRMVASGRTGWYMRVLKEGNAPVSGPIVVEARGLAGVTVLDAHRARFPGADLAQIERVAAVETLAPGLREHLQEALGEVVPAG